MNALRVLIVEDDPQIAEIQRRFLERMDGVELCGLAHTLADARDLVEVLAPDLLLLDVYFPDGSGLDLLRALRASGSHTDVILITAAREVDTLRNALHGGVFDYILKPLVYERLNDALQRYRAHRQRLEGLNQLAQEHVDALLPRVGTDPGNPPEAESARPSRLPKGIDPLTLENVRRLLHGASHWTAEDLGGQLGASRTTARRYLEYLVGTGELEADVSYGTVGRPERRYRLARH
ncbi:response regulator [Marinobacter sp. C2H3]|uniref:response regulator n=1 Tax=Marinobacter sp. C2H3 TaxID=3119003 RepID=UPI00300F26CE